MRLEVSFGEALARMEAVHTEFMRLFAPLSDADLLKPYRRYLPEESGDEDGPAAHLVLYGNTAGHYQEHLVWIAEMIKP